MRNCDRLTAMAQDSDRAPRTRDCPKETGIGDYCRTAALAMMLVAASASASAPKNYKFEKAMHTNATYDQTWSALIEVFADNNWAIQTIEKDSGLIATDWLNLGSNTTYADCGGSGLATVVGREIRFNVFVRSETSGSTASVTATFRELRRFDGREKLVDCSSTGHVEAYILSEVDALIARRTSTPPAAPATVPSAPSPDEKPVGTEGGRCYGNQTCNTDLQCDDAVNECVAQPPTTPP